MHSKLEIRRVTKLLDQLNWSSHAVEGRDLQQSWIIKIDRALILILLQQSFKHSTSLLPVLGEHIPFPDVFRALSSGKGG